MKRALTAILAAAVITVIVGGLALNRMVREFNAEPYSDVSTPAEAFIRTTGITREESSSAAVSAHIATPASEPEHTTERITAAPLETTTETWATETTTAEIRYNPVPGGYIGYFKLTAYEWTGNAMANGEMPYYGACACNRPELWGTYLYIEGHGTFKVCDTGSVSVMGYDTIDIFLGDSASCDNFGVQYANVYYAS